MKKKKPSKGKIKEALERAKIISTLHKPSFIKNLNRALAHKKER